MGHVCEPSRDTVSWWQWWKGGNWPSASDWYLITYRNVKIFHPGFGVPLYCQDKLNCTLHSDWVQEKLWEKGQDREKLRRGRRAWFRTCISLLPIKSQPLLSSWTSPFIPVSLSTCLPIHPPIFPPSTYTHLSTQLPIYPSICLPIYHPLTQTSVHLTIHLPIHPLIKTYPSIHPSHHLPIHTLINPSHCQSTYPSTYQNISSIHLTIYPLINPSHHLPTHSLIKTDHPPTHPRIHPSIHPLISLSTHHLFIHSSIYLIYPPHSLIKTHHPPIHLSISSSFHLSIHPSIFSPSI